MNYMKELNAFYDWLETNSLSTSAIALWHALMHVNNRAGWIEEFGVATSVLCAKTGLSDRAVRNARNELKQKGRIEWKSRRGNQSAVYKIISLVESMPATVSDKKKKEMDKGNVSEIYAGKCSGNTSGNTSGKCSGNASTLNKLDKTKQIVDVDDPQTPMKKTVELFQKAGMGQINQTIADILGDISDNYPYELIEEAFKIAGANHATSIRYVEKILMAWEAKGIKSLEQLEMYRKNRRRDYGSAKGNNGRGNGEEDPYADIGITL